MAFDTYTNLQLEILDLVNRDDVDDKVPSWIALVEAELQRILQGRQLRTEVAVLLSSTGTLSLPADFGTAVSLTLETTSARWPIELTTYERMQVKQAQLSAGLPRYACVIGDTLRFPPTDSDAGYAGVLIYDADLTPLSSSNPSNWVLANHPDIYLYGAALHSAPYLKDDERIRMWRDEFYRPAIEQVRVHRDRAEFGANTPIIRPKSALGE